MRLKEIIQNDDITIVPFRWYHPRSMRLRDFELKSYVDVPNYETQLRYYEAAQHSHTALLRGEMVASFGVHEVWPGVGEGWLITSHQVAHYPITLTRMTRRYLDIAARELQLHRLQITCNVNNQLAVRWASRLKFDREGLLRRYGPDGSDYIMLSRIFDE